MQAGKLFWVILDLDDADLGSLRQTLNYKFREQWTFEFVAGFHVRLNLLTVESAKFLAAQIVLFDEPRVIHCSTGFASLF